MLNLSSSKSTPKPSKPAAPAAPAGRPDVLHFKLSSRDMPIVRTTGNLAEWRALHGKVRPVKTGKSGSQILKAMRAARESRRS